jgi:PAS domain S-box-containing protein
LAAGADDYLVKPFAAAELLARVRANVELARLRSHQSRWRTALVDSLQEAFFICDERGAVVEVNAAFTDILGYGPDGLPYEPTHPWWPDIATEPEAHRGVQEAFTAALQGGEGSATVPVTHRDGHRVWLTINVRHTEDPETGRRVIVGSFRDVTAEHHLIQRESAMGELNAALAQADTVDEALNAAVGELQRLWQARRVVAAGFPRVADSNVFGEPDITCAGAPIRWGDLPQGVRERMAALRDGDLLHTDASEPGSAAIALAHPDGVLVVYVELADQRRFSAEDATLLTVLTGRLGQGLQRVHQLDQQREAALALQNAILGPAALPRGFAVRYEPASRPLQVGGDWYDVVDLEDGRIGLIVGDCVGHGLAAATVMGQLRSACRALLLERPSPSSTLTALDRFASQLPGARTTTAFCAVLTPETGELVYSSAGHPPPIMVHADQTVELLEDGRTIPLGSQLSPVRGDATVVLPPRATLLLYTDGLIERRRESLDRGISRAADVVVDHRATALDELADLVMARLTPDGGYLDDVAVLLYRQPAQLELEIPAEPTELAPTRAVMRKWLSRAGVSPDQSLNVLIAVGEALANAIEHGHRDRRGGTVSVRAMAVGDRLRVVIADAGSWKTPEPEANPHRGRGITLMRGLVNEVSISPGPQGTTVAMDVRIG